MKELQSSPVFEGDEGNKIFSHSIKLVEEEKYKLAGRLVALSMAHEGPAPHFFNTLLFELMVGSCPEGSLTETDQITVLPANVQDVVKQVSAIKQNNYIILSGDGEVSDFPLTYPYPSACLQTNRIYHYFVQGRENPLEYQIFAFLFEAFIAAHRDHFVQRLFVSLVVTISSCSHTFT